MAVGSETAQLIHCVFAKVCFRASSELRLDKNTLRLEQKDQNALDEKIRRHRRIGTILVYSKAKGTGNHYWPCSMFFSILKSKQGSRLEGDDVL